MLKKKLFLIFAFCFFISNSVATTKQSYKIHLNLENILLKGRDIKKSNDFIEKDNVEFNFQNYIEKNSFIEITFFMFVLVFDPLFFSALYVIYKALKADSPL